MLDNLELKEGKTKEMVKLLDTFKLDKSVLVVTDKQDALVKRASGNIQKLLAMPVELLNTYDVVSHVKLVTTKQAIEKLQEVYGG